MWPEKLIPLAVIVLIVVLIIFGPKQLPELGKSLGKTMKSIREGAEGKDEKDEELPEGVKSEAAKSDTEAAKEKEPAEKA